jgi:hypothetical protein
MPAPPPAAQIIASPTAVAPVIMVDTTPVAMSAEGLQAQQPPKTIRIKRPVIGGNGSQDEEQENATPKHYSQAVSFIKLS